MLKNVLAQIKTIGDSDKKTQKNTNGHCSERRTLTPYLGDWRKNLATSMRIQIVVARAIPHDAEIVCI
jgi:hypothetical protein